jgi:hypothetical protein
MKKLLFISATLIASGAFAGTHVENITRDIKTKAQQGDTQTMLLQDGMLRVNAAAGSSMILKGSNMLMIDDKNKQYREMTKEEMKKMAEQGATAMARIREQLKNMKPEQRAEMERVMGKQIPGGLGAMDGTGKPDVYEAKNLGKSATVEGRQCQLWTMSRNGELSTELCVVPFATLPGSEDFGKAFKGMAEAFGDLAKTMPGAEQTAKAYASINGYPVRTRYFDGSGKFRPTENILTKWVIESIPASSFQVPAGYKKMQMPKMN